MSSPAEDERPDTSAYARDLGIAPDVWRDLRWHRVTPATYKLGELSRVGFTKDAEIDARGGGYLIPLWWRTESVRKGVGFGIVNHRFRFDAPKKRGKYDFPHGKNPLHGAYGRLWREPTAWQSPEVPLIFCEGEKKAAALASFIGDKFGVVSCPGVWNQAEGRSTDEKDRRYPKRVHDDLRHLELRKRVVYFVGDRDAVDGTKPAVRRGTDDTCKVLAQRGAKVFEAFPPPGAPKGIDDWIVEQYAQHHPDEADAAVREQLESLLSAAEEWLPPEGDEVGPAPAHAQGARLRDVLGKHWNETCGSDSLAMPPGFCILETEGVPLGAINRVSGLVARISSSAFWPVAEVATPPPLGRQLRLAAIIRNSIVQVTIGRDLIHDRRKLCQALARYGVNVHPDGEEYVPRYLTAFLEANELPLLRARDGMGWDQDETSFMLGDKLIGRGSDILIVPDEDEATKSACEALHAKGDAETWKATAEAMLSACPAFGLTLAASVASPMLRLFGWPTIGICFGAIGGAGKSSILRAAASVWGWTGTPAGSLDGVVRNALSGTPKGSLAQFRRMADLPHFLDELKPNLADRYQIDELSSLLHQLFEGADRVRAARSGNGARLGASYPGCPIIAGEVAAPDYLRQGGVIRRYFNIEPTATDGESLGRFREPFAKHYGHLGPQLVRALVDTTPHQRWQFSALAERYLQETPTLADWLKQREPWPTRARQLATALAAADVASRLVPAIAPDLVTWHESIINAWNANHDAEGDQADESDPVAVVERKIRGHLASRRMHLWASSERRRHIDNRLKFSSRDESVRLTESERCELGPREPVLGQVVESEHEGEEQELLLKVDVLQTELTKFLASEGYSARTIMGALIQRGFVEQSATGAKRSAGGRPVRVGGQVVYVYRLVLARSSKEVTNDPLEPEIADEAM